MKIQLTKAETLPQNDEAAGKHENSVEEWLCWRPLHNHRVNVEKKFAIRRTGILQDEREGATH